MKNRRTPACYEKSNVANYLKDKIKKSGIKHKELARLCDYNHPNNIAMITMGHSKMAVNKIPLFAKALDIDECFFLDLVLGEYEPELYELIKRNFKGVNKLEKNIKEKDIDNKDNPSLSLECALDISRLDWNDAKLIIDNLDEEELIDFEKHASKLNLKKIAWHNIRISMSTYAKIKNKAIKLNMNPTKLFNHMLNSI